jgi:hypothetical protein
MPEGAILFCTETEVYYSLNHTGVRIWQMLPPVCAKEDEIVARLSEDNPEVNLGTIAADVRRLLEDLVRNGLAEVPQPA